MPTPPSGYLALAGAVILFNLSGSNEAIGKAGYRRQLVAGQSARCLAAYAYAGAGTGESTTDLVFGGHCLIAEDGVVLAESERFRRDAHLTVADVDVPRLQRERQVTTSFAAARGLPTLPPRAVHPGRRPDAGRLAATGRPAPVRPLRPGDAGRALRRDL